jgi:NAD(P)-dependent dehydrogenase (short-subunit alcohol dehydrogenase family)
MTLAGKIALVTGASRGVGRGIARCLGEAGATVYVTGRTVQRGPYAEPGSIQHIAREIEALGGRGIPVRCDHGVDAEVRDLFERIERESGRLDILVNNAHSGVRDLYEGVGQRFWETPPELWDRMNRVGLRGHYVASVHAARMMVPRRSGLIINVSSFGALSFLPSTAYGVGKAALDRMTSDMAIELRPFGVAVVSIWPGIVRSELTAAMADEATPGYRRIFDAYGESPVVSGRAVAALASDPDVMRLTGRAVIAAEIARRHGLRDEGGSLPLSPRSFRRLATALLPGRYRRLAALVPPMNAPLWLARPVLARCSMILKEKGSYRRAAGGAP